MYNEDMNAVKVSKKAFRQLTKLPVSARSRIIEESKKLKDMPNCQNVKALVNNQYQYRLRVGNYRVFFDFDGTVKIVSIEEVKKRDEHTY
jgi:mRNA-degrading endonuclease RelE of RelBE toxin-antitoxin system